MLRVIDLAFCCYAVTDPPRARAFYYECVPGLKPTSMAEERWVEYDFGPDRRTAMIFDRDGNSTCIPKRNPGR